MLLKLYDVYLELYDVYLELYDVYLAVRVLPTFCGELFHKPTFTHKNVFFCTLFTTEKSDGLFLGKHKVAV